VVLNICSTTEAAAAQSTPYPWEFLEHLLVFCFNLVDRIEKFVE
jgi:hypothetical protein